MHSFFLKENLRLESCYFLGFPEICSAKKIVFGSELHVCCMQSLDGFRSSLYLAGLLYEKFGFKRFFNFLQMFQELLRMHCFLVIFGKRTRVAVKFIPFGICISPFLLLGVV